MAPLPPPMTFQVTSAGPVCNTPITVDQSVCTFGPDNQPTGLQSIYSATFRVGAETVHGKPFSTQTHHLKITISKGARDKIRKVLSGFSASEADKIHYRVVISTPNADFDMGILRHQTDLKGDALHCRCSAAMFTVHIFAELGAFGRKWRKLPAMPTSGRLVQSDALGKALQRKTSFTKAKWEAFGVTVLDDTDYFVLQREGKPDAYYGPVPKAELGGLTSVVKQRLDFDVVCELKSKKGPDQTYRNGTLDE